MSKDVQTDSTKAGGLNITAPGQASASEEHFECLRIASPIGIVVKKGCGQGWELWYEQCHSYVAGSDLAVGLCTHVLQPLGQDAFSQRPQKPRLPPRMIPRPKGRKML